MLLTGGGCVHREKFWGSLFTSPCSFRGYVSIFKSLPYTLPSSRWEHCPEDGEGVICAYACPVHSIPQHAREACQLGMVRCSQVGGEAA